MLEQLWPGCKWNETFLKMVDILPTWESDINNRLNIDMEEPTFCLLGQFRSAFIWHWDRLSSVPEHFTLRMDVFRGNGALLQLHTGTIPETRIENLDRNSWLQTTCGEMYVYNFGKISKILRTHKPSLGHKKVPVFIENSIRVKRCQKCARRNNDRIHSQKKKKIRTPIVIFNEIL